MKIFRYINDKLSVSSAVIIAGILTGLIIGASVFFTTMFFFGGVNNKTKLFLNTPVKPAVQNPLSADQIKRAQEIQQQRLQIGQTTPTTTKATSSKAASVVKPK